MRLDHHNSKWRARPDGEEKVTGKLAFLTDMSLPDMLYGKVFRSEVPHAKIVSIDVRDALRCEGVVAVLTHNDIPGINGFGIAQPNQPVFCDKVVRYMGDAVAAIAAMSEEIAEKALSLIRVDYEPMPIINSPEVALRPDAPKLHQSGNILHQTNYSRGEVEEAFLACDVIVEETYHTPRQMHTYLETEGGLFVYEEGRLTVYAPTQHGYKDRMQLARILACSESNIRIISSPIGGSFGGKDELNVQPYGALLAIHTGKPVKMHYSRRESVIAGLKRHPMKITMKTGVDSNGKLLAHEVSIISDTGAYATLGAPVLNFATEHCIGPYSIPHVKVNGKAVYTNNGVSGEFRGFGGNQVIFALEGQIDRLADQLQLDAWEFRNRNLRKKDDLGPLGQRIVPTTGANDVWQQIQQSPLWKKRNQTNKKSWLQTGIGAALAMHGSGLGYGIPDHGGGTIRLNRNGKIEVAFGHEEMGQGLLSTLEILLIDFFQCDKTDIEIVIGDTDRVPVSGSSTASRTTNMVWQSLQRLKPRFIDSLFETTMAHTGINKGSLRTGPKGIWSEQRCLITYQELAEIDSFEKTTQFHFPTTPDPIIGAHFLYTSTAVVCEVEVNRITGMVKIQQIDHAVAAGPVINPLGYLGQIEGGGIMAVGFTQTEDAVMENGHYLTKNLDTYMIPTIFDIPRQHHVEAIEKLLPDDQFGPRGVGEIGTVAVAPAIIRAIFNATGIWITKLPISPEQLIQTPFTSYEGS